MDMKALAEAAVARKKKKAAGIEAGAVKTESDRVGKASALKLVKVDDGDVEKQKRIAASFAANEIKRKQAAEAAAKEKEEQAEAKEKAEQEEKDRKAIAKAKADAERKRAAAAAAALKEQEEAARELAEQQERERLAFIKAKADEERRIAAVAAAALKEKEDAARELAEQKERERINAQIAKEQAERKRLAEVAAAEKKAAAALISNEKKEAIGYAAARAEEVRLAKLHGESEESHKWSAPPNLGLGKGEKPPAFKQLNQRNQQSQEQYETVPGLAGAGGIPIIPGIAQIPQIGQVVAEPTVKPTEAPGTGGGVRQFEPATEKVEHKETTAQATVKTKQAAVVAGVAQTMECVTQEDLKVHARNLEVKPAVVTEEYKQKDAFVYQDPKNATTNAQPPVAAAPAPAPVAAPVPTAPATTTTATTADGKNTTTTTTTTYTVTPEPSTASAQSECCIIL